MLGVTPFQIKLYSPCTDSQKGHQAHLIIGTYILAHLLLEVRRSYMNVSKEADLDEDLYTCQEVAEKLRITAQTVRLWIIGGRIDQSKCFQIGKKGHWRIHKSAVEKMCRHAGF